MSQYTEQDLEKAEALFNEFMSAMPEITVDPQHPDVKGVDVTNPQQYIKESMGNFLSSL
ncbi:hypothetical protein [Vibrio owensii]|uniref:hypothetical protein n=1 Tax=Vibrio harveyi group TaxID=717610 RepID=UPI003CC5CD39